MAPTIDRQSELFPEDLRVGGRKRVLVRKNPPQGGDYYSSCTVPSIRSRSGVLSIPGNCASINIPNGFF